MRYQIDTFDPGARFVVRTPMTFNGIALGAGSKFPKRDCDARRLRLLYEQRKITMRSGSSR